MIFTNRKDILSKANYMFILIATFFFYSCTQKTEQVNKSASNEWKVIGPGGGGGVLKPTISPFDENFIFTHCDMTAAYVSLDGGKNWNMNNLWNVPEDFEFDPVDPGTVYVATRGFRHSEDRGSGMSILFKSFNKGKSWRIIYPDVSKAKKAERLQNSDLLPSQLIPGAFDGSIDKVSVDPVDNKKIFIGMSPLKFYMSVNNRQEDNSTAVLLMSIDGGETWKSVSKLPGKMVKAIFPGSERGMNDVAVVFTESACVHVNMNTGELTQYELPVKRVIVVDGGYNDKQNLIYIQSDFQNVNGKIDGGMFVSSDSGKNWVSINNGILDGVADGMVPGFRQGLAVCESKPEVAYISTINPITNSNNKIEAIYSIYKTVNAGKKWEPVLLSSSPRGYITGNFEGSWMEKSFDPGWGGAPIDLGVAPGNPDVCFAGDNGRGYKTTDGGKTWKQKYSHNLPDGSYASGGLDVTTCYGVHFDPFDKEHIFICYTDMGLFNSFNDGKSWFHALEGIPRNWENTCYDLKFDPDVKDKVWSVWANAHDLPREKMFGGSGDFDRFEGGVAVSVDGGRTWSKSNSGMPENAVCTNFLIDKDSPKDAKILYVSVYDKGVYKSVDGGKGWTIANNGFGDNLYAWELRQNSEGRLFTVFSRGRRNFENVDGAIYFSDDKAETWSKLSMPEGVTGPHDLLLDPERSDRMYLCCWPKKTEDLDKNGGVYKTEDGGKTWRQVFDERVRVNSAGIESMQPDTLYINTFQNAAYRSADAGETWSRIEGYRFKWGQKAVPDVNNPGMLYLTTYGGSVFHGPAKGVPGVFEGIENMPENWW